MIAAPEDQLHWLALRMTPGLGARTAVRLLASYRSPQAILRAPRADLEAQGVAGSVAQSLSSGCAYEDAAAQQRLLADSGAVPVVFNDPRYPERLKEIFDPPPVLFCRGRLELLSSLVLAVVGTRRPTPYGLAVTGRLAGDLARAGLTIASGMARGIDTAAHRGALDAEGATIAVLGSGVDVVYPKENAKLAAGIAERGLIVSEFPMAAPPYPQNFPIRNRVISGLSLGVLVVEGAQYSGSSITARLALEQGREVFAVPGSILSKMSWGPNLLIKQGAKLVQDWNDVVVELAPEHRRALAARAQGRLFEEGTEAGASAATLSPEARKVLAQLRVEDATHIDDLLERLEQISSSEVIAALFELEMMGAVRQLPGKNFVKTW